MLLKLMAREQSRTRPPTRRVTKHTETVVEAAADEAQG